MQKINLYQHKEEIKKVFLSFYHMLELSGVVFLLLVIISGYKFYSAYQKEIELAELQTKQQNLNKGLETVQSNVPTEEERQQLLAEVQALEKIQASREKMYATLSKLQYSEEVGFSNYLKALAKYSVPGLWFTKITFSSGGSFITLEGKALESEFLPKLILNLGKDPSFAGKTFDLFRIYRPPPEVVIAEGEEGAEQQLSTPDFIRFILGSKG